MTGLSKEQVEERIREGKININTNPNTRSYKQILISNTLTFFNFLNLCLVVLVLFVGSYKNSTFFGVILINTGIGIIQEIRAKKTIDRLAILTQRKSVVLREGRKWSVATEELVLDDVIFLKNGDQIPADAVVLEGSMEVNESLLTGEADALSKKPGDTLFSGSFVTSGEAYCQVVHVGGENYASKITSEAKEFKRHNSELRNALNAILKVISIIIVPLGALLFYKQFFVAGNTFRDSVVSMVAAVLGMIPEGLVLLTSVALTLGALVLAKQKTLVQELFCIETLAHVDTLCLDKTGTITEGTMCVEQVEAVNPDLDEGFVEKVMRNLAAVLPDDNATSKALKKRFPAENTLSVHHVIPFSSERKYSGAVFKEGGTCLIGALQFLFPDKQETVEELAERSIQYGAEGYRVLVLAHSPNQALETELPEGLKPAALLLISDVIRPEAAETFAFFEQQGVDLKVISGDDPVTVAAIAKKAGLKNTDQYVDTSMLSTDEELMRALKTCSIFGRVTPQQKRAMVLALKAEGHTVAMTGDGVNDVLAFKEADCSIAMAQGSDAAKNTANIVLMDSNFASMPKIVNQGRRVVNNIRTAASMFLIKTIFSVLLALLTICFGQAYPFEPIQMSLISACAVGIPTFLLAQENNFEKIDHTFLRHVFMNAFPPAVTITGCVFIIMLVCQNVYHSVEMMNTACVLVTGWNYMSSLKTIYAPLNRYRKTIIYGMQLVFFTAAVLFQNLLTLKGLEFGMIILVFVLMTFSPVLIGALTEEIRKYYKKTIDTDEPGKLAAFINRLRK